MKKIKFLSRKLKAFTLNDIFMLSETPKTELKEILDKLVKEKFLKETSQGYVYCDIDYMPPPTAPIVKNETVKFIKDEDYVTFSEDNFSKMKSLTFEELNSIPEYNRKNYIKYFGLLKITKGLYGKQLIDFIKEYNKQKDTT